MTAATLFFILLGVGIMLICAEIFLPGGMLGGIGALALIGAMLASFRAFPHIAMLVSVGIIILLGLSIVLWVKYFPKSRFGRQLTLSGDEKDFKASQTGLDQLIGKEGIAHSDLRPAGYAMIDGQRVDVVSEGGMISKGTKLRVVKVEGNRVVVRKFEA